MPPAIRADAELRDLPIVVLSAPAGEEASVEGIAAAGPTTIFVKPFSARRIGGAVDGVLATARVRRAMTYALREEAATLEILNRVGIALAGELDLASRRAGRSPMLPPACRVPLTARSSTM